MFDIFIITNPDYIIIMFDIFNYLNDSEWFDTPYDEMQELLVCQESGYIATDLCIKKDTVFKLRMDRSILGKEQ